MKLEFLILAITGFFIANTYHDGNYIKLLQSWQKYFKMAGFAFAGLSIYLFLKKNPSESQSIIQHATNIIKYMPSAKTSVTPLSYCKPIIELAALPFPLAVNPLKFTLFVTLL